MALLYEFKDRLKEGKDNHGTFRTDSLRAFRLYGNDHWDQKDKDHLEGQQRPAVTFNKTTPIINAVSGSEITNRFETRFFPRTADDEMFAEIVTETLRYIRQRADVEHEESGAFRDAVICGMGATEFWLVLLIGIAMGILLTMSVRWIGRRLLGGNQQKESRAGR